MSKHEIRINGFPVHNSDLYINAMNYIIELVDASGICGNFNFVNLINYEIASKYGFTKSNDDGVVSISNDLYDCLKVFEHLGIIVETDSCNRYLYLARKYCIDKLLFLAFYSLLWSIEQFTRKQIELLHKKELGNHLEDIIQGISNINNEVLYKDTTFRNVIEMTYSTLGCICAYAIEKYPEVKYCFNDYVYFFEKVHINNVVPPPGGRNIINNIYPPVLPFLEKIGKSWFTNKYLLERVDDSKDLEIYYDRYLKTNKHFSSIFAILEKKYDRIHMLDLDIPADEVYKLPGITETKKKEILCDVVKYWVIKNCPLLNYVMELIDDIKELKDSYRMNIHISIMNRANQYGTYAYRIHFSARMTNDFCSIHKAKHCVKYSDSRECYLLDNGFDEEDFLDLHGSIFSLTRCLNKHVVLDLAYDIKKELEKLKIRGFIGGKRKTLEAKDYKYIGFYVFFPNGCEAAYHCYKNRYKAKYHKILKKYDCVATNDLEKSIKSDVDKEFDEMRKNIPHVSENDFKRIYNCVQYHTGGTNKYSSIIFIIESAIMAKAVAKLMEKGIETKNVYDCIWWKGNINRKEIEETLIECAQVVFDKYYELTNPLCLNTVILNESISFEWFFD